MKMKMVAGLVSCALYIPFAQAGSLTVANSDLNLAGGLSAGMLYSDNTGGTNISDFAVTDFLLELSAPADKGLGFTAGYGVLKQATVFSNVPATQAANTTGMATAGLQYGWLTVKPSDAVTIDAGMLATKIGYEAANTLINPHVLIAALWTAQPVYYPGARATFAVGDGSVFIEGNEDTSTGATSGYALGGSKTLGAVNLSVAYYNANKARDILDVIVSSEIGGVPVAANFDYHKLDNQTAGQDDSATGLGLYAAPSFGSFSVPVRIEYMNDGTSGVYNGGVNTAYTFTVSPCYHYTKNTFVRAEFAMVKSDNKVFLDDQGVAQDSKNSAALQVGYLF